jgi:hypothetical protein
VRRSRPSKKRWAAPNGATGEIALTRQTGEHGAVP